MQIPNLATAAAIKAKNTAANPATPTATENVFNQKPVKVMVNIQVLVHGVQNVLRMVELRQKIQMVVSFVK